MFLPGFPAPSPEVISALLVGEKPTPFDALADGMDLWERRFGLFPEVAAYVGSERLGQPEVPIGLAPVGLDAGGPDPLDVSPQWQRVMLSVERLPSLWKEARKAVWSVPEGKGWETVLVQSTYVAEGIRKAFEVVGRGDMDVLRRSLTFLEKGIWRWVWVVGLLQQQGRPLTPALVLQAMSEEGKEDLACVLEAVVVIRLLQGKRSMASYVLSRWVTESVWGPCGLGAAVPLAPAPWLMELSWAWGQRDLILGMEPYLSERQRADLEALRWESARPHGIAAGSALMWDRIDRLSFGESEGARLFRETVALPWVDDRDVYGEIADGAAIGWRQAMDVWESRQYELRDQAGRLERVLLPVVDGELATSAAAMVLRWRHHFECNRIWREPPGFVAEVQDWLASVLGRMDGKTPPVQKQPVVALNNHWFKPAHGLGAAPYLSLLTEEQESDWRVTEFLRPLVFSALASMAIGMKAGHAAQLQELDWVREKIWDPSGPEIRVDQAFAHLLLLCGNDRCSVPQLRELPKRLGRQLGVKPAAVKAWLEAQPFTLLDLEEFRQMVVQRKIEALVVGGLVETLNARPHFKPSWMTGVLTGLAMPRPHGEI